MKLDRHIQDLPHRDTGDGLPDTRETRNTNRTRALGNTALAGNPTYIQISTAQPKEIADFTVFKNRTPDGCTISKGVFANNLADAQISHLPCLR